MEQKLLFYHAVKSAIKQIKFAVYECKNSFVNRVIYRLVSTTSIG